MKELLVPVGNMESLIVAVKSGADAVYLGGKKFGARAYANNFDNEEMIRAIKFCHLYGVKIYVTVNTLIYESEFEEAIEYLQFLHINGVDAVIVQDIGLIVEARRRFPNLEIHASTQVHNTNQDGINYLYSLGVKRVVFARELSIDEIDNIQTPMEKEAFIHGALCISFSGQCLFSSLILNRSGNRGACAQLCRLPYKLMENNDVIKTDGNYLLSTKELNTSYDFKRIMESSIMSLKIEGRMKSPEYVGCVTKLYRDLINKYNLGMDLIPNEELLEDLKVIFNRDYTNGLLFKSSNENLMNIKTSNHVGVKIGHVIKYDKKYVYIKLDKDLNQGDGIRFSSLNEGMIANYIYDSSLKLISGAKIGNIIALDNRFNINECVDVYKTLDTFVINKYRNVDDKKINIDISFEAHIGSAIFLKVSDGLNHVCKKYGIVLEAKTQAMGTDRIFKQLNRLASTPFIINNIDYKIDDNIFISIKDLNEIRRMAIDELIKIRENIKREVIIASQTEKYNSEYDKKMKINVFVRTEEQLKCCLENHVDLIYVENKSLYNKYKDNNNILFRTRRVYDDYNGFGLVTELGALYRNKKGIADYFLNVCNHHTINEFMKYMERITLSVELEDNELERVMKYFDYKLNSEIVIYSRFELMLMKYCPLKMLVNKDDKCHVCLNKNKYYIVDRFEKKYPIITDFDRHVTRILNYKVTNKMDNIDFYKRIGINNYRIELFDESYTDVVRIINDLKSLL